jgi:hypothetical protein
MGIIERYAITLETQPAFPRSNREALTTCSQEFVSAVTEAVINFRMQCTE